MLALRSQPLPGEILREEFLGRMGLTQVELAEQRVNEIVRGKRGVTPQSAWLLAQALGTTTEFWMNLQAAHDLAAAGPTSKVKRLRSAG